MRRIDVAKNFFMASFIMRNITGIISPAENFPNIKINEKGYGRCYDHSLLTLPLCEGNDITGVPLKFHEGKPLGVKAIAFLSGRYLCALKNNPCNKPDGLRWA